MIRPIISQQFQGMLGSIGTVAAAEIRYGTLLAAPPANALWVFGVCVGGGGESHGQCQQASGRARTFQ
jgi:hypothetical protein